MGIVALRQAHGEHALALHGLADVAEHLGHLGFLLQGLLHDTLLGYLAPPLGTFHAETGHEEGLLRQFGEILAAHLALHAGVLLHLRAGLVGQGATFRPGLYGLVAEVQTGQQGETVDAGALGHLLEFLGHVFGHHLEQVAVGEVGGDIAVAGVHLGKGGIVEDALVAHLVEAAAEVAGRPALALYGDGENEHVAVEGQSGPAVVGHEHAAVVILLELAHILVLVAHHVEEVIELVLVEHLGHEAGILERLAGSVHVDGFAQVYAELGGVVEHFLETLVGGRTEVLVGIVEGLLLPVLHLGTLVELRLLEQALHVDLDHARTVGGQDLGMVAPAGGDAHGQQHEQRGQGGATARVQQIMFHLVHNKGELMLV